MKLNAKELVKLLLTKEELTQKELAVILTEKTDKKYTQDGLSRKLSQGTITYNEYYKINYYIVIFLLLNYILPYSYFQYVSASLPTILF